MLRRSFLLVTCVALAVAGCAQGDAVTPIDDAVLSTTVAAEAVSDTNEPPTTEPATTIEVANAPLIRRVRSTTTGTRLPPLTIFCPVSMPNLSSSMAPRSVLVRLSLWCSSVSTTKSGGPT